MKLRKYPKIKGDAIVNNRHGIGDLDDLLKLLSARMGNYNIKNISKPRNDAIHNGREITSREASDAIMEARKIILNYSENEIVKYINTKT